MTDKIRPGITHMMTMMTSHTVVTSTEWQNNSNEIDFFKTKFIKYKNTPNAKYKQQQKC